MKLQLFFVVGIAGFVSQAEQAMAQLASKSAEQSGLSVLWKFDTGG